MVTLLTNIFFWLVECLLSHQLNTEKTSHPTPAAPPCPSCGSHHTIKNGSTHNGKPKRQCKDCGRQFVEDPQWRVISADTQAMIDRLLLEKIPLAGIVRVMEISARWLQTYVNQVYKTVSRRLNVSAKAKKKLTVQMDELGSFVDHKGNRQWVWLAMDAETREIIGCAIGDRSKETAKALMGVHPRGLSTVCSDLHGWVGVLWGGFTP